MKDKEKAKQIAEESQILSDFPHDYHSVEYGALEMAKWKDEQFQEEKKKWFDKACMWIESKYIKNSGGHYSIYRKENIIKSFKQAMEE